MSCLQMRWVWLGQVNPQLQSIKQKHGTFSCNSVVEGYFK